jgi:lipoate-protein ligase A
MDKQIGKSWSKGGQKLPKSWTFYFYPQITQMAKARLRRNYRLKIERLLHKCRPSELRRYAPRNDKLVACGKKIAGNNQSADYTD